ncbi:FAD-dependent monooxygenase [Staphylococcus saprophyticus]|uniref:FAD-dependent oxidoreductase n=1 Tax=Staphylococcus saprophyticus TaxID=29385 RepID=UPI00398B4963
MSYPTDMDFMVNVTMELIQNIERMAHHPSLILLFGNNEIDMTYTMLTSDGPRTAQTRDFFEVSKITDENMKHIMQTRYKTLFLETIPGVTLLGDAAHLMAPSGEGANLAMYDAAELGKLIVEYPNDIELALENYEQALFKRSAAEAEESHELLDLCLGQDAPYGLIALFEGSNEQN